MIGPLVTDIDTNLVVVSLDEERRNHVKIGAQTPGIVCFYMLDEKSRSFTGSI